MTSNREHTGTVYVCGRPASDVDSLAPYPSDPRLALLTLSEARDAVRLLMLLADDSEEGREAERLAGDIGLRLPSE